VKPEVGQTVVFLELGAYDRLHTAIIAEVISRDKLKIKFPGVFEIKNKKRVVETKIITRVSEDEWECGDKVVYIVNPDAYHEFEGKTIVKPSARQYLWETRPRWRIFAVDTDFVLAQRVRWDSYMGMWFPGDIIHHIYLVNNKWVCETLEDVKFGKKHKSLWQKTKELFVNWFDKKMEE